MVAQPRTGAPPAPGSRDEAPEEGWLAAARQGDARAFESLVNRGRQALYQMAYHQLGSPEEAQDCCQDALLSAWRSLRRFEGDWQDFQRWLMRILVNRCRDQQRMKARKPAIPLQPTIERKLPGRGQSPQDYAELQDLRGLLETCLAQLSPAHREIVLLDHLGYRYTEMAEILGVETGTVKSRLSRARADLRDRLNPARPAGGEPFGGGRRLTGRTEPTGDETGSDDPGSSRT